MAKKCGDLLKTFCQDNIDSSRAKCRLQSQNQDGHFLMSALLPNAFRNVNPVKHLNTKSAHLKKFLKRKSRLNQTNLFTDTTLGPTYKFAKTWLS